MNSNRVNSGRVNNSVASGESLEHYTYRGARAVVLLHDEQVRRCLEVWKQGKAAGVILPQTDDPDYASLEALLAHIFRAARGYMVWMCKNLKLPDPEINPVPELSVIEEEAEGYLEHLLERWRSPLADYS